MANLLGKKIKYALFKKAYQIFGRNSFSQAGEDLIMDFLLRGVGITKPYYLELGVYHPRKGSNTYKFYVQGGIGVLIEADPRLIKGICAERPNDNVLHFGVGLADGVKGDFYVFDEPSISSFDKQEATRRHNQGKHKITRTDEVPLKTINSILCEDCKQLPDILSIDIEGLDFDVLNSLNFQEYPIPIICAETCIYSKTHIKEKDPQIFDLMKQNGYFIYADTYINTIFVHSQWFENKK